jgi:hypothetical protein
MAIAVRLYVRRRTWGDERALARRARRRLAALRPLLRAARAAAYSPWIIVEQRSTASRRRSTMLSQRIAG